MGSNVLIINGHQHWDVAPGRLNRTLVETAKAHLEAKRHAVKTSRVEDAYVVGEEVEKILWADAVIFQVPVYWMSVPWRCKQYIDEVYFGGYGRLFNDDGRGAGGKYGSGGMLKGRKYMLSTTWNAPLEAFTDPAQFFEAKGVDGVFFHFHKAQRFLGMEPLPTFSCHDVMKAPDVPGCLERLAAHLDAHF